MCLLFPHPQGQPVLRVQQRDGVHGGGRAARALLCDVRSLSAGWFWQPGSWEQVPWEAEGWLKLASGRPASDPASQASCQTRPLLGLGGKEFESETRDAQEDREERPRRREMETEKFTDAERGGGGPRRDGGAGSPREQGGRACSTRSHLRML